MRVRSSCLLASALLAGAAALSSCGAPGLPAKATVTTIDRTCEIVEKLQREVDDPRGKGTVLQTEKTSFKQGECKSVAEWQEVRKKRTKDIQGSAVVHLDYVAPQDGKAHSGTLTFTGRDDEFYALNAGDTVDILVAKNDPERIRKA